MRRLVSRARFRGKRAQSCDSRIDLLPSHREKDTESGLMYFRARSYDPRIGRFVQMDPVFQNRPMEHYIYAKNMPSSATDPTGREIAFHVDGDKSMRHLSDVHTRVNLFKVKNGIGLAGLLASHTHNALRSLYRYSIDTKVRIEVRFGELAPGVRGLTTGADGLPTARAIEQGKPVLITLDLNKIGKNNPFLTTYPTADDYVEAYEKKFGHGWLRGTEPDERKAARIRWKYQHEEGGGSTDANLFASLTHELMHVALAEQVAVFEAGRQGAFTYPEYMKSLKWLFAPIEQRYANDPAEGSASAWRHSVISRTDGFEDDVQWQIATLRPGTFYTQTITKEPWFKNP